MKKIVSTEPRTTGVIELRGAVVGDSCTCELTDALDAAYRFSVPGTHAIGLVPPRNGSKAFGIAVGGTVHAYVYTTGRDVITGAEVIDGAYGPGDGSMLDVLLRFVGRRLVYVQPKGLRDMTGTGRGAPESASEALRARAGRTAYGYGSHGCACC